MELLRPAVLGCCDSLGGHWSGAWSHSVRSGSRPEASRGGPRCGSEVVTTTCLATWAQSESWLP